MLTGMSGNEAQQFCVLFNAEAEAAGWPMRCDALCEFSDTHLQQLLALWRQKAKGGVPPRSAFDMRTMRPFMRNIAIVERVETETEAGHSYQFRLFGSALSLLFGEHSGQMIDEMVLPSTLPGWIAFYDMVLAVREPLLLANFFRIEASTFLKGEMIAAPLADDEGEVRFALAATFINRSEATHTPFALAGPLSA